MKIRSNILLIFLCSATAGLLYSSCRKQVVYPPVPYIEYVSFTKIQTTTSIDSKGILKISFTDGDGDIGLSESDTLYPFNPGSQYYYDLFITYYEKQHGNYVAVTLPMTNNSRIPVVTPDGENKSIKGTIEVELFINNPASTYDTIAYDVSIVDRALNMSNKIRTPDIIIHK
jgi:hypothetical protein